MCECAGCGQTRDLTSCHTLAYLPLSSRASAYPSFFAAGGPMDYNLDQQLGRLLQGSDEPFKPPQAKPVASLTISVINIFPVTQQRGEILSMGLLLCPFKLNNILTTTSYILQFPLISRSSGRVHVLAAAPSFPTARALTRPGRRWTSRGCSRAPAAPSL